MKNIFFIATLTVLSNSLFASALVLTPEVKTLLAEAKQNVKSVSATELKTIIKNDSAILVDVRNPNEWGKNGIKAKRVIKISRGFLEVKYPKLILKNYKKNDPFIVYCGIEPRSIFATARLKELGFTNVKYLKGGLKNFK